MLYNYVMNINVSISLTTVMNQLIPKNANKLYLINNNLLDESCSEIFQSLTNTVELKTLVVSKNGIGP